MEVGDARLLILRKILSISLIKNGFLRKTILNLVYTNANYNNKSTFDTRKVFPIQAGTFEILGIPGKGGVVVLP